MSADIFHEELLRLRLDDLAGRDELFERLRLDAEEFADLPVHEFDPVGVDRGRAVGDPF